MFKKNQASTVSEYLISIPSDRSESINILHKLIQKQTGYKPYFANNMIGYGEFEYINSKKQKLNWTVIALANQKNYISIYVCAIDDGEYIAEKYKEKLGKVSVGKSCIRIKKLEDINIEELKKVLKLACKKPGLI